MFIMIFNLVALLITLEVAESIQYTYLKEAREKKRRKKKKFSKVLRSDEFITLLELCEQCFVLRRRTRYSRQV